jgi:hypothetical protein
MLECVHAAENLVTARLAPETVRCRVRAKGVVIELDQSSLAGLQGVPGDALAVEVAGLFRGAGFDYAVAFEPYRTGSAFLHFKRLTSASPAIGEERSYRFSTSTISPGSDLLAARSLTMCDHNRQCRPSISAIA